MMTEEETSTPGPWTFACSDRGPKLVKEWRADERLWKCRLETFDDQGDPITVEWMENTDLEVVVEETGQ